jgi:hypothetical protein
MENLSSYIRSMIVEYGHNDTQNMLGKFICNKSKLLHTVGQTRHFILSMQFHTNTK